MAGYPEREKSFNYENYNHFVTLIVNRSIYWTDLFLEILLPCLNFYFIYSRSSCSIKKIWEIGIM